jgi:mercuric ion transport protein
VASLLSAAPWLVTLSRHKIWTFTIAGVLITISFVMTYLIAPRLRLGEACDADDPTTCGEVSRVSRVILWGSAFIWSCGPLRRILTRPNSSETGPLDKKGR